MFDFERGADFIVGVGVHAEVEGRSVSFGSVIIVRGQDLYDLPGRDVLRQHWSIILRVDREQESSQSLSDAAGRFEAGLGLHEDLAGFGRI